MLEENDKVFVRESEMTNDEACAIRFTEPKTLVQPFKRHYQWKSAQSE